MFQFILGMIPARYVGFSPLNQSHFVKREPALTGILELVELPPKKLLRPVGPIEHTYCDQLRDVQHIGCGCLANRLQRTLLTKWSRRCLTAGRKLPKNHLRDVRNGGYVLDSDQFSRITESVFVTLGH